VLSLHSIWGSNSDCSPTLLGGVMVIFNSAWQHNMLSATPLIFKLSRSIIFAGIIFCPHDSWSKAIYLCAFSSGIKTLQMWLHLTKPCRLPHRSNFNRFMWISTNIIQVIMSSVNVEKIGICFLLLQFSVSKHGHGVTTTKETWYTVQIRYVITFSCPTLIKQLMVDNF